MKDIENAAARENGGRWNECREECFTRCMIDNLRPGCHSCRIPAHHARIQKKQQDREEIIAALKELGYEIKPINEEKS